MKYKVGDRVKVREDLESGNCYENVYFNEWMENFRGKTVTISAVHEDTQSLYLIKEDEGDCKWTDEMFEGLAEYTYEDLCNAPVGTKITFENGEILVKNHSTIDETLSVWTIYDSYNNTIKLKYFKDEAFGKIIKIEEPQYTTVYEAKKDILDEKEKEYLSNVIKPFKDKVKYIIKGKSDFETKEYIFARLFYGDGDATHLELPDFPKGTMYKGMEVDREYSLEELGLN